MSDLDTYLFLRRLHWGLQNNLAPAIDTGGADAESADAEGSEMEDEGADTFSLGSSIEVGLPTRGDGSYFSDPENYWPSLLRYLGQAFPIMVGGGYRSRYHQHNSLPPSTAMRAGHRYHEYDTAPEAVAGGPDPIMTPGGFAVFDPAQRARQMAYLSMMNRRG